MPGAAALRKVRLPNARRQFEHRQRERDGVRCYSVPVDHRVIAALLDRGMAEAEALDAKAVARELADVLRLWAQRWHEEKNRNA